MLSYGDLGVKMSSRENSSEELKIGTVGPTFPPPSNASHQAKRNEEQNYDSIWFPDHLMGWWPQSIWTAENTPIASQYPSPHTYMETMTLMALAAKSTETLEVGCAVTETFRRHPAMLAQSIATLDLLSEGRIILGLGAGEGMNVTPYGIDFSKAASRLEEAIEVIKVLWGSDEGETVDYDGDFWRLKDATFDLPLYGGRHPPIWVASHGPRMLELTGKYGDGWIPFRLKLSEYSVKLNKIRKVMKREGRDPSELVAGLYASVVIDETEEDCLEIMDSPLIKAGCLSLPAEVFEEHGASHPLADDAGGLMDYIPSKLSRKEAMEAVEKVPMEVVKEDYFWGSPEKIMDDIDEYIEAGLEHIVFWNHAFLAGPSKVGPSFRCLRKIVDYYKS